jgi:hypothetical protein
MRSVEERGDFIRIDGVNGKRTHAITLGIAGSLCNAEVGHPAEVGHVSRLGRVMLGSVTSGPHPAEAATNEKLAPHCDDVGLTFPDFVEP